MAMINWIRDQYIQSRRVLKVTKRPDTEEFKTIVKVSGLGMTVIGMIGFIIAMIYLTVFK
jgi:protein transport protein SEC61 subunit gamma and related proteins